MTANTTNHEKVEWRGLFVSKSDNRGYAKRRWEPDASDWPVSFCRSCGVVTKDVPGFPYPKCGKCGSYKRPDNWPEEARSR